jgi:protein TonB
MRLALAAKPLIVLTQDAHLIAAVRKVTDPVHEVLTAAAEIDLSTALIAHHSGVAVLDCAALSSHAATLAERLHAQFPELVLIAAGNVDEQAQLAARITDGSVYRFLHKPFSEQRVRLFVEAAWRRHAEVLSEPRPSARSHGTRAGRALGWWLALAALALLAALAAPLVWLSRRQPEPAVRNAPPEPAAIPRAPAADAELEQLLARAARALASGALTAPPGENARDLYREALRGNPHEERAANGLAQLLARLLENANGELQAHHLDEAQRLLEQARALGPDQPRIALLAADLSAQRAREAPLKAQEPAAKPADTRLLDYLNHAREALARGQLIEPPEDNARLYLESAHALAPQDPAVQQGLLDLRARLQEKAHQALEAGNPEQADKWAAAALDAGVDPERVAALHEDAQQLREQAHTAASEHLALAFNERLGEGHIIDPDGDSAKFYLAQLMQQDGASAATRQARRAYGARVLDEAQDSLQAQDLAAVQRWLGEARAVGADAARIDTLAANLGAAQDAARQADSYVNEHTLTRTRYVAPQFPELARTRGIEGWVDLQFLVGTDGSVSELTVVGAQPAGIFEQAALDAVRQWRYQAVTRAGQNVSEHTRVRVRFAVQR